MSPHNGACLEHSGVCNNIQNIEKTIDLERTERVKSIEDVWRAIDKTNGMINKVLWTVACSSVGIIVTIAFMLLKSKIGG
jgi:hypothetical protein